MDPYHLYTRDAMGTLMLGHPLVWMEDGQLELRFELWLGSDLESLAPMENPKAFTIPFAGDTLFLEIKAED